jgi:hypothetical protein
MNVRLDLMPLAREWGIVGLSLDLQFEGADLGVKVSAYVPAK